MSKGLRISLQGTFPKSCFDQAFELVEILRKQGNKPVCAIYTSVDAHPNTIELGKQLADRNDCFSLAVKVDVPKFYQKVDIDLEDIFERITKRDYGYLTITDKIREQVALCYGAIVGGGIAILPPEPYLDCAVRYKDIYYAFRDIHGNCPMAMELKG